MDCISWDVIFVVYCWTVDAGVIALMVFSFLKCICNKIFTENHRWVYAIFAVAFAGFTILLAYCSITKGNYSSNLCITIGMITSLTVILLFCLIFRVFEVLRMKDKKSQDKECERKLQRKEKELSFGGVLLSFLGVAFPLFVQANSALCTTAGAALGLSAFAWLALLIMFARSSQIVWDVQQTG